MSRLLMIALAGVTLAACDAPDPASFSKHAVREGASTGSHIAGTGDQDSTTTTNTHFLDRMNSGSQKSGG